MTERPSIHPETADPKTLVDRLRGIYRIPIRDGLGAVGAGAEPDNPNEYVQHHATPPIQHAAAAEIERLRKAGDHLSLMAQTTGGAWHMTEQAGNGRDLALKLDKVLAGQEQLQKAVASNELVNQMVLKALRESVLPAVNTLTEMVGKVLELAAAEPAGGGELAEAVRSIAASMAEQTEQLEHIGATLNALPKLVEQAVRGEGEA